MEGGSPRPGFGGGHQLPASLLAGRSGRASPSQSCRQRGNRPRVLAAASPAWLQEHPESGTGLPGMPGHGQGAGTLLCLGNETFH